MGVDLGTTYTAAATCRDGRAQMVALATRGIEIPSVVAHREDGVWLTGEAAERRASIEPNRIAREFKRRFGDSVPLLLGGSPFGAEHLSAVLLRGVLDRTRELEDTAPQRVAVTHPANWGNFKLDLLRQTVSLADIENPLLISEPEAAATYYAAIEHVGPGAVVAVYDLGGGTFDVAVLHKRATGFEILGEPQGIERLGGIDFDEAVFGFVSQSVSGALSQLDPDDRAAVAAVARLRAECVAAKEALSSDTDAIIHVALPNVTTDVRLTRGEFETMIRPSLTQTITVLERALRSANVTAAQLTKVLLVGGSSRIPLVAEVIGGALSRPVAVDAHPKHAIALGAALAAQPNPSSTTTQVLPAVTPPPAPPAPPAPSPPPPPPPSGPPRPVAVPVRPVSRRRPVVPVVVVIAVLVVALGVFLLTRGSGSSQTTLRLGDGVVLFTSYRTGDPELFSLDVDSGALTQLTHEPGFDGIAAISPDRRTIAYLHSDDPDNEGAEHHLMLMRADASDRRLLVATAAQDARPTWSPDGSELVVVDEIGSTPDLRIVSVATGESRPLVTDDEKDSDPSWSPDGRTIIYTRDTNEGQQTWSVPVDGSAEPRLLIDDGGTADAEWSHDGTRIVYDGNRRERPGLAIVDADGSNRRELFFPPDAGAVDPFWSPDDSRVVFQSDKSGNEELYVIDADGSGLRKVTDDEARDNIPCW